jgi:hypothetical protein
MHQHDAKKGFFMGKTTDNPTTKVLRIPFNRDLLDHCAV